MTDTTKNPNEMVLFCIVIHGVVAMAGNKVLHSASKAKKDEFYTSLEDVSSELHHYKDQFKGKVIFCNCDDPYESNFFKYFAMNFQHLGIKKLIATCYTSSAVEGEQLTLFDIETALNQKIGENKRPYKIEITEVSDVNGDGAVDLADVEYLIKNKKNVLTLLKGDGDFRSSESIELLKEADLVVTNPPFSLFREYIAQLIEHEKKFLVLGNMNAVTYKEIFPLIAENKLWLGYDNGGKKWFRVPDTYNHTTTAARIKVEDGIRYLSMGNTVWFTNLDLSKRHEFIKLYKKYSPNEYPHYENYDAINVDHVKEIPSDWEGVMGVPITFLDKYNPEQFEIVAFRKGNDGKDLVHSFSAKNKPSMLGGGGGITPYFRILIRALRIPR